MKLGQARVERWARLLGEAAQTFRPSREEVEHVLREAARVMDDVDQIGVEMDAVSDPGVDRVPPTAIERLRMHSQHLMEIPSGEQYLGHIQAVLAVALKDVADWMVAQESRQGTGLGSGPRHGVIVPERTDPYPSEKKV